MTGARRRFRFINEIAEGGFGKVFLAEQLSADGFSRIVAIKLLHSKWSSHDEVVMRTRDEARLLGLIRHQHIVRVEDLTSIDGKCAIVMEYLEGVDLKAMMGFLREQGSVFPRGALFEIMIAVASALDAAYNGRPLQGGEPLEVIHRDIKPSNIFVTVNSAIKVLDFGTARANFAEREAKTQALAFGSQGYMAPERMLGEEDTPAADVFSLGISLYELLALENFGRIPPRPNKFAAKMEDRVASIPLTGDPEWCDQVRDALRGMMSYEPDDRPSARKLVEIFEVLAQNSADSGFRRFCRTLVAEAKAAQPEFETGDPLTGTIVNEDVSSTWKVGSGPDGMALDSAEELTLSNSDAFPTAETASVLDTLPTNGEPRLPDNFSGVGQDEPMESKGGAGKIVVLLLLLVGLFLVLVLGVVVLAGGGYWMSTSDGSQTVETEVEKPPEIEKTPPPATVFEGSKIVSPGNSKSSKSKATVLTSNLENGSIVRISESSGFQAEWDGQGEFDLGKLPAGSYSATIKPATGKTLRGKRFKVDARRECRYTFDVKAAKWDGACK